MGSLTDVPWGVQFPEMDRFRHPVVLYDGLKNFLLVPILLWVRSRGVPPGFVAALFVFLYASLRIPIDLLREYPITLLGLPTGQTFNILMSLLEVILLVLNRLREPVASDETTAPSEEPRTGSGLRWRCLAFAAFFAVALVIPSDATRDIPTLYGDRHPGLEYSAIYVRIE